MNLVTLNIVKFFKTTTLHGFKYLVSRYYLDSIGWAVCCIASACCSGVLCVVLWERFQKMPALLQLRDVTHDGSFQPLPSISICQPPDVTAQNFLEKLKTNGEDIDRLPGTLYNVLEGKSTDEAQVDLLEDLLKFNNVTLLEMLQRYAPECSDLIKKCRWRDVSVNCQRLFRKELTSYGECCVATPARLLNIHIPSLRRFDGIKRFDLGLQCSRGSKAGGCEFFVNYFGEEVLIPTHLSQGFNYNAHLTFTSEKDNDLEKLVQESCISSKGYSRNQCLLKCTETRCGCSDPFRKLNRKENEIIPPPCPLKRLSCLRSVDQENTTCSCLPACQIIRKKLVMEQAAFNSIKSVSSLDPIYSGLNNTHGVVLRIRMNFQLSKLFILQPTESWLTLLSSLGGVFNMFLGVGLFSALEFFFFMFIKLPVALLRRSTEKVATRNVVYYRY